MRHDTDYAASCDFALLRTDVRQPYADQPDDAVAWHEHIAADFDEGYQRSAMFQERLAVWDRLLDQYIAPTMRVLDAGCGPGLIGLLAAGKAHRVVAVDASPAMLAAAQGNARRVDCTTIDFVQADVSNSAIADRGPFDAILCSSVLEYVEAPEAVLIGFSRMLDPNGVLILSMPNRRSLYRLAERLSYTLSGRPRYLRYVANRWTLRRMVQELARHGFEVNDVVYYGRVPIISKVFGWFGVAHLVDTLYAIVAHRRPIQARQAGVTKRYRRTSSLPA